MLTLNCTWDVRMNVHITSFASWCKLETLFPSLDDHRSDDRFDDKLQRRIIESDLQSRIAKLSKMLEMLALNYISRCQIRMSSSHHLLRDASLKCFSLYLMIIIQMIDLIANIKRRLNRVQLTDEIINILKDVLSACKNCIWVLQSSNFALCFAFVFWIFSFMTTF